MYADHWFIPKNRLMLGLMNNAMLLGVGALGHFGHIGNVEYWEAQIEHQAGLIIFGTQMTSLYFTWVSLVPLLIIINIHFLFKDILKRGIPRLALKFQNLLMGFVFLGAFLLVAGNWFINPIWADRFQDAGFVECENRVLNIRKALFNDVWVRNSAHCNDPKLRYILHEHFGDEGFEQASQYLSTLDEQRQTNSP